MKRSIIIVIGVLTLLKGYGETGDEMHRQTMLQHDPGFYQQPLLKFKTPKSLDICGEPVPLERRDVWERLDKQLLLALGREAQVILWLKRSRQYLPYIEEELKKRKLPEDLKYLAVAESDLNTYALSPKGAAGTWQFMKETGIRFGLKNDDWKDQRYSFFKSTDAALDYLTALYQQFGQWMLAVAAYNCGEKRLSMAIAEQKIEQFVDLYLPRETEEYLYRIMAIKIILSNPASYGFILEEDDYYLSSNVQEIEINLTDALHLRAIAQAAKTTYKKLKELNPELRGNYVPAGIHRLLIPAEGADGFHNRMTASATGVNQGMKSIYVVKQGDTLTAIAAQLGVPLDKLALWNELTDSDLVYVGQHLIYYRPYGNR